MYKEPGRQYLVILCICKKKSGFITYSDILGKILKLRCFRENISFLFQSKRVVEGMEQIIRRSNSRQTSECSNPRISESIPEEIPTEVKKEA